MPIALLFVDFRTALILVAISHASGSIGRITFFRQGFNKRLFLLFGLPSVLFTLLGALLVNYISQSILKSVLGIFLVSYSAWSLLKQDLSLSPSTKNSVIGGGLSGFFAGLIGTGGVLRGAFYTAFNLEKSVYLATAAAVSLSVDVTRIPVYATSGFLSAQYYYYIPILFSLAILGSFTGRRIMQRIPQKVFRKLIFVAIMLLSIKLIYDGFSSFF